MTEGIATFDDWMKCDLRVAQIVNVEEIEGADKLYKLTLDVGKLGERIICAGLREKSENSPLSASESGGERKKHYSMEELMNKKIIYFSNLAPRKIRGVESQGMLLAASNENHSKVILISPEKEIENGSRVG